MLTPLDGHPAVVDQSVFDHQVEVLPGRTALKNKACADRPGHGCSPLAASLRKVLRLILLVMSDFSSVSSSSIGPKSKA